jgi:hypothetical protein
MSKTEQRNYCLCTFTRSTSHEKIAIRASDISKVESVKGQTWVTHHWASNHQVHEIKIEETVEQAMAIIERVPLPIAPSHVTNVKVTHRAPSSDCSDGGGFGGFF